MKPRPRPQEPYRWQYDFIVPLHLYLDDVSDIFVVLSGIGPVVGETDRFTDIASFDDLLQLEGQPQRTLRLVAERSGVGSITTDFNPSGASITITSSNSAFVGALHQVQAIAWRHWRRFSLADNVPVLLLFAVAVSFLAGLANAALIALVGAGAAILVWLGIRERRTRWTLMPMVWYANRPPSFLQRNRDQVILSSIFTVLGAALGIMGTLIVQAVAPGLL